MAIGIAMILLGSMVVSESLAKNITFCMGVVAFLLIVWYTRSAPVFFSGYLFLSCWNLGNGFASTNFVLDGALCALIVDRFRGVQLKQWMRNVRLPIGVYLVFGGVIFIHGGMQGFGMIHLQLQGFLFGVLCSLESRSIENLMMSTLRIFGALLALFCFIESSDSSGRMSGPHASATAFGVALAMTFAFLFSAEYFRGSWTQTRSAIVLVSLIVSIILTGTRSAALAVLLTVSISLLLKFGRQISLAKSLKVLALIFILAYGVWVLLPDDVVIKQTFSGISKGKVDGSTIGRLIAWKFALDYFISAPVFGIGIGQFFHRFPELPLIGHLQHAHSLYLNTLAETGIVGGVILIVLLGVALHRSWIHRNHPEFGVVAKALFVCVIVTMFLGIFDTVPYYPSLLGIAWFIYSGYLRLNNGVRA